MWQTSTPRTVGESIQGEVLSRWVQTLQEQGDTKSNIGSTIMFSPYADAVRLEAQWPCSQVTRYSRARKNYGSVCACAHLVATSIIPGINRVLLLVLLCWSPGEKDCLLVFSLYKEEEVASSLQPINRPLFIVCRSPVPPQRVDPSTSLFTTPLKQHRAKADLPRIKLQLMVEVSKRSNIDVSLAQQLPCQFYSASGWNIAYAELYANQ